MKKRQKIMNFLFQASSFGFSFEKRCQFFDRLEYIKDKCKKNMNGITVELCVCVCPYVRVRRFVYECVSLSVCVFMFMCVSEGVNVLANVSVSSC